MKKIKINKDDLRIAKLIKKMRKKQGLSQKELSDKLGYTSSQYISNLERNVNPVGLHTVRALGEISGEIGLKKKDILNAQIYDYKTRLKKELDL